MADRSITELNELIGANIDLDSDQIEIVDVSEAQAADKNKRVNPNELTRDVQIRIANGV